MSSLAGPLLGNDPVERFIHRLSLFEPLDAEAREALRRAVNRGPLIPPLQELHPEAFGDVSVLLSGWICHFRLLTNGRRQITAMVVPGDFVDFGFLSGTVATAQCVTTAHSQLGRIRTRTFTELAAQFPAILRASQRAAATDAAIGRERIISLGVRTATERLASILCELWYRLSAVGLTSAEGSYDLPMTQAELGAAVGLSTVHVNRTLQVLRRTGAISLQSGKVWIRDLRKLTALAGFDPVYLSLEP
ncbi:Crp/Fnr family transcriptional regulator [Devosia rhizoryzae]|uniref:Crp/Fnr family transcriptional regulator n=1 Tax=Devosia rhizoryzae TaxID=2774137 RepID=A0ABX7C8S6_9HYPH|nr:Crp/Fnr family transcriptional regulator [Devosia rhizoryzae]QQR39609.1 Crp/Fnr family transcriptional regulator [Devosia rhizoryzae]